MGVPIKIEFAGQKQIDLTLEFYIKNIKDLRPAWNQLERRLNKFQKSVFLGKGKGEAGSWFRIKPSFTRSKWKALAEDTIDYKKQLAGVLPFQRKPRAGVKRPKALAAYVTFPMIRTGKLMNAFTKNKAKGAYRYKTRTSFGWGIDEDEINYAAAHHLQKGVKHKRKLLRIPANFGAILRSLLQRHIVRHEDYTRTIFK